MNKAGKEEKEVVAQENILQKLGKKPAFRIGIVVLIVALIIGGIVYWQITQSSIYVEKSEIYAPVISISSSVPGVLEKVRVSEGDTVGKGTVVAVVGDTQLKTMTSGIIIAVQNTPGQVVTSLDAIVKMIDPTELRVIGHVEEDKGLKDVKVGHDVIFTVDAFDSKQYHGKVDMIVPSARQSDIVFSISDQRQEKQFDVKVKFDINSYPELRNGMSAKMWIYK